jgi:Putative prokaryotic signal transducing protein
MSEQSWERIGTAAGDLQAEILKGLLEAQGIPVVLSQEGAGQTFGLTVGRMGEVDILVPTHLVPQAQQVLDDYEQGKFESSGDADASASDEAKGDPEDSGPTSV